MKRQHPGACERRYGPCEACDQWAEMFASNRADVGLVDAGDPHSAFWPDGTLAQVDPWAPEYADAGAVSVRAVGAVALVLGVVSVFIAFGWWLWLLAGITVAGVAIFCAGFWVGTNATERSHEFDRDLTHIATLRGDS